MPVRRASSTSSRPDAFLGLGSNMGDKAGNIARAIAMLTEARDIRLVCRSRDYRSAPWGKTDQDWFVNACIGIVTELTPEELLRRCQEIEHRLGRVREERWGARVIDVDLLAFRDMVASDPALTLPHPLVTERAFVLVPLAEIAPDLMIKGTPVREWAAAADRTGLEPVRAAKRKVPRTS
jgi:2-amino-4-hydroxy-6-hydroxymethyldihydropteridine diphosphokinase